MPSRRELDFPRRELDFSIRMEACPRGTAPAGVGGYTCEPCGGGSYSDGGPNVVGCTKCPRKGVECTGQLRLLPGFFRVADGRDTIDERTELHECWSPRGCFVNLNESLTNRSWAVTHRCERGYTGPLCGMCDAANRYAKTGVICTECWDRGLDIAVLALLPIAIMAFVVYVSLFRKVKKSSENTILVRILLPYIQTLGTLSSIYVARGTEKFREIFGFSQALGDSPLTLSPLQCEMGLEFYTRFGITVSVPFIIAVLSLLVNILALTGSRIRSGLLDNKPKKAQSPQSPKSPQRMQAIMPAPSEPAVPLSFCAKLSLVASSISRDVDHFFVSQGWLPPIIFVLNLGYASLTTTCFSVWNCLPYTVGGVTYLASDLSVQCYDSVHNSFRGLSGFLIACFGLGFPALFAYILRVRRDALHRVEVFEKLGFLYDGYSIERGMYAWESIVMARKAAAVMIGSLVKDAFTQGIAGLTLLALSLFLHSHFQPYQRRMFNLVEGIALLGIIVTMLISMFYLRIDNLVAACVGAAPDTVVDAQDTTFAEVAAMRDTNDVIVTFSLPFLNLSLLGGMLMLMLRVWIEENTNPSARGRSAEVAHIIARKLGIQPGSLHAKHISVQTLMKPTDGEVRKPKLGRAESMATRNHGFLMRQLVPASEERPFDAEPQKIVAAHPQPHEGFAMKQLMAYSQPSVRAASKMQRVGFSMRGLMTDVSASAGGAVTYENPMIAASHNQQQLQHQHQDQRQHQQQQEQAEAAVIVAGGAAVATLAGLLQNGDGFSSSSVQL